MSATQNSDSVATTPAPPPPPLSPMPLTLESQGVRGRPNPLTPPELSYKDFRPFSLLLGDLLSLCSKSRNLETILRRLFGTYARSTRSTSSVTGLPDEKVMSFADFQAFISKYPLCHSAEALHFFRAIDFRRDGELDELEFVAGLLFLDLLSSDKFAGQTGREVATVSGPVQLARQQLLFLFFDADGDGLLSIGELTALIQRSLDTLASHQRQESARYKGEVGRQIAPIISRYIRVKKNPVEVSFAAAKTFFSGLIPRRIEPVRVNELHSTEKVSDTGKIEKSVESAEKSGNVRASEDGPSLGLANSVEANVPKTTPSTSALSTAHATPAIFASCIPDACQTGNHSSASLQNEIQVPNPSLDTRSTTGPAPKFQSTTAHTATYSPAPDVTSPPMLGSQNVFQSPREKLEDSDEEISRGRFVTAPPHPPGGAVTFRPTQNNGSVSSDRRVSGLGFGTVRAYVRESRQISEERVMTGEQTPGLQYERRSGSQCREMVVGGDTLTVDYGNPIVVISDSQENVNAAIRRELENRRPTGFYDHLQPGATGPGPLGVSPDVESGQFVGGDAHMVVGAAGTQYTNVIYGTQRGYVANEHFYDGQGDSMYYPSQGEYSGVGGYLPQQYNQPLYQQQHQQNTYYFYEQNYEPEGQIYYDYTDSTDARTGPPADSDIYPSTFARTGPYDENGTILQTPPVGEQQSLSRFPEPLPPPPEGGFAIPAATRNPETGRMEIFTPRRESDYIAPAISNWALTGTPQAVRAIAKKAEKYNETSHARIIEPKSQQSSGRPAAKTATEKSAPRRIGINTNLQTTSNGGRPHFVPRRKSQALGNMPRGIPSSALGPEQEGTVPSLLGGVVNWVGNKLSAPPTPAVGSQNKKVERVERMITEVYNSSVKRLLSEASAVDSGVNGSSDGTVPNINLSEIDADTLDVLSQHAVDPLARQIIEIYGTRRGLDFRGFCEAINDNSILATDLLLRFERPLVDLLSLELATTSTADETMVEEHGSAGRRPAIAIEEIVEELDKSVTKNLNSKKQSPRSKTPLEPVSPTSHSTPQLSLKNGKVQPNPTDTNKSVERSVERPMKTPTKKLTLRASPAPDSLVGRRIAQLEQRQKSADARSSGLTARNRCGSLSLDKRTTSSSLERDGTTSSSMSQKPIAAQSLDRQKKSYLDRKTENVAKSHYSSLEPSLEQSRGVSGTDSFSSNADSLEDAEKTEKSTEGPIRPPGRPSSSPLVGSTESLESSVESLSSDIVKPFNKHRPLSARRTTLPPMPSSNILGSSNFPGVTRQSLSMAEKFPTTSSDSDESGRAMFERSRLHAAVRPTPKIAAVQQQLQSAGLPGLMERFADPLVTQRIGTKNSSDDQRRRALSRAQNTPSKPETPTVKSHCVSSDRILQTSAESAAGVGCSNPRDVAGGRDKPQSSFRGHQIAMKPLLASPKMSSCPVVSEFKDALNAGMAQRQTAKRILKLSLELRSTGRGMSSRDCGREWVQSTLVANDWTAIFERLEVKQIVDVVRAAADEFAAEALCVEASPSSSLIVAEAIFKMDGGSVGGCRRFNSEVPNHEQCAPLTPAIECCIRSALGEEQTDIAVVLIGNLEAAVGPEKLVEALLVISALKVALKRNFTVVRGVVDDELFIQKYINSSVERLRKSKNPGIFSDLARELNSLCNFFPLIARGKVANKAIAELSEEATLGSIEKTVDPGKLKTAVIVAGDAPLLVSAAMKVCKQLAWSPVGGAQAVTPKTANFGGTPTVERSELRRRLPLKHPLALLLQQWIWDTARTSVINPLSESNEIKNVFISCSNRSLGGLNEELIPVDLLEGFLRLYCDLGSTKNLLKHLTATVTEYNVGEGAQEYSDFLHHLLQSKSRFEQQNRRKFARLMKAATMVRITVCSETPNATAVTCDEYDGTTTLDSPKDAGVSGDGGRNSSGRRTSRSHSPAIVPGPRPHSEMSKCRAMDSRDSRDLSTPMADTQRSGSVYSSQGSAKDVTPSHRLIDRMKAVGRRFSRKRMPRT